MASPLSLSRKKILITGASRGIGHAAADYLLRQNAFVWLHYNRNPAGAEALHREFPDSSQLIRADLAQTADCKFLFEQVTRDACPDAIVFNAGIAIESDPKQADSDWLTDWNRTIAVNLTAPAYLAKLFIPEMKKHGDGRFIFIASRASFRGDTPEYLAYGASKGGLVPLSRSIARHFGKSSIKSFLIAPGFVRTDMAQDFMDKYGDSFALDDIALPRLTEPEDLAPTIALLCSGLADHATGCTIDINAGSYVH